MHQELIDNQIRQKAKSTAEQEEAAKIAEEKKIAAMEPLEKKRYLRQLKKQAQLEEDAL